MQKAFLLVLMFLGFMSFAEAEVYVSPVSYWTHNNSVVGMRRSGKTFAIWYEVPSPKVRAAGVARGTVLFEGTFEQRDSDFIELAGRAYTFSAVCGPIPYDVAGWGTTEDGRMAITLQGAAPLRHQGCEYTYSWDAPHSELKFYFFRQEQE